MAVVVAQSTSEPPTLSAAAQSAARVEGRRGISSRKRTQRWIAKSMERPMKRTARTKISRVGRGADVNNVH